MIERPSGLDAGTLQDDQGAVDPRGSGERDIAKLALAVAFFQLLHDLELRSRSKRIVPTICARRP